ncbi:DUF982 domain-containing protein [Brucella haematophila]|uniref:DUF982 domain-containing protein n=1 Tax=Brucella haematophila TaxID=419474 RepID=UPI001F2DDCFD|nr:DUF982 domain-containing protein [Brucella haematophila]
MQACLADLEGLPNTARKSFVKAARAAGMPSGPVTGSEIVDPTFELPRTNVRRRMI